MREWDNDIINNRYSRMRILLNGLPLRILIFTEAKIVP